MTWQFQHIKKNKKDYPHKLFCYRPGSLMPSYIFTRESLTTRWIGHGFNATSMAEIKEWVRSRI